jgi:hypothetical protein
VSKTASGKPPAIEDVPSEYGAYVSACIGCGQRDNHPKILTGDLDKPPVRWHHDCFVIAEQPGYEAYAVLIEDAKGATGHALREHIMANTSIETEEVE